MLSEAVMDALQNCISTAYGGTLYDISHWSVFPVFLPSFSNHPRHFSRALVHLHTVHTHTTAPTSVSISSFIQHLLHFSLDKMSHGFKWGLNSPIAVVALSPIHTHHATCHFKLLLHMSRIQSTSMVLRLDPLEAGFICADNSHVRKGRHAVVDVAWMRRPFRYCHAIIWASLDTLQLTVMT